LSWFDLLRKDSESNTMNLAQKQITTAIRTVTELKEIITAFPEGKSTEMEERIEALFLNEVKIDELRRLVFKELSKQALPSKYREDLLHIVKRLDVMADHVKDSARNIKILLGTKVPKEIWDTIVRIAETLVNGSVLLGTAIEMLAINPPQAMEFSKKVDEQESIVDDDYLKAKALLLKYDKELGVAALLILKDLLECMERIADTCADTADYIRVLAIGK
jgi:predicted phosphate transport protein (TIGR00153 family)